MTKHLEALIEWLGRRGLRGQLLAIFLDCIVLDTLEDLTWTPEPGYGLSGPDRATILRMLRAEHDLIWAMTYEQVLDHVPFEDRRPIAVPNRLPVVMVVNAIDDEFGVAVQLRAERDGPGDDVYLSEGPAFWIGRDGTRDPDDGWWEAGWR